MNKYSKNNFAFTLIELIVVIAIIAILAAIVMVNVMQYISKSKDAAALADLNQLSTSAISWFTANNGSYAGFCANTNPDVLNIATAIGNLGSGYTFSCSDPSGSYPTAYNPNSLLVYASPVGSQNCNLSGNFVAWVISSSGKYATLTPAGVCSPSSGGGSGTTSVVWTNNPPVNCACPSS
ncbi:MAG: prepilin-type N-terminal cleavage/methylation domain-containing protein [Candidatus Staskawiczbacteria bacterium]